MKTFGTFVWLIITVMLPVSAGLFKVWVYQDAVHHGYQLSESEQKLAKLRNNLKQLEIEFAAERSPAHLLQLARTLNLLPPTSAQVLGEKTRVVPAGHTRGGGNGQP